MEVTGIFSGDQIIHNSHFNWHRVGKKKSVFSIAECEDDWDSLIFFPAVKQAGKCIDVCMQYSL